MSAWAKPGVKCVCIDANFSWDTCGGDGLPFFARLRLFFSANPRLRGVYTVGRAWNEPNGTFISLIEFPGSGTFLADLFRPLAYPSQSLEHDVAQFRDIPAHAPALESEDA